MDPGCYAFDEKFWSVGAMISARTLRAGAAGVDVLEAAFV